MLGALQSQLNGSSNALGGLAGPNMARTLPDAASDSNLSLHNLRSKSPWEGIPGMSLSNSISNNACPSQFALSRHIFS